MMRRCFIKILFLLPLLLGSVFSLNELIKIELNESSNVFLINLSEKGLEISITQYKAYKNNNILLDNLTYITIDNFSYLWFNNTHTTPFDTFYLAKEGESNIEVPAQTVFAITINNQNNYDLEGYQMLFDISTVLQEFNTDYIEIKDMSGNSVNFCYKQPNGACNTTPTDIIWVRVPFIPANGETTLIVKPSSINKAGGLWYNISFLNVYDGVLDYNIDYFMNKVDGHISVSTGFYHTCILKKDGNVYCYGAGDYHDDCGTITDDFQCGQSADYYGGDAIQVATGTIMTCILKSNKNVECYGGETITYEGGDAIAISVGEYDVLCILKESGNVECIGSNLGYNGGDAIGLSYGGRGTLCVLKENGNVFCDGYFELSYSGRDAVGVAVSITDSWYSDYACILKNNGNVKCFSDRNCGGVIDYTEGDAISVVVGWECLTCILKKNGNVVCYGGYGGPEKVNYTGGDAIGVSTSGLHTCILKVNGTVECRGEGEQDYGEEPSYGQSQDYTGGDVFIPFIKEAEEEPTYTISNTTISHFNISLYRGYLKDYEFEEYKLYLNEIIINPQIPNYLNEEVLNISYEVTATSNLEEVEVSAKINNNIFSENVDISTPLLLKINLSNLGEGNHTFFNTKIKKIIDGFELSDMKEISKWFIYDKTPPEVSINISIPEEGKYDIGNYPKINYSLSFEDEYLSTCEFKLYDNDILDTMEVFTSSGSFSSQYNIKGGPHTLNFILNCLDKAGNNNTYTVQHNYSLFNLKLVMPFSNPQELNDNLAEKYKDEIRELYVDIFKGEQFFKSFLLISKDNNISTSGVAVYRNDRDEDYSIKWRIKTGVNFTNMYMYQPVPSKYMKVEQYGGNVDYYVLVPVPTEDYITNITTDKDKLYEYIFISYNLDAKIIVKSLSFPYLYFYYDFSKDSSVLINQELDKYYKQTVFKLPEGHYLITIILGDGRTISKAEYLPPIDEYIYVISVEAFVETFDLNFIKIKESPTSQGFKKNYDGYVNLEVYLDNVKYNETSGISSGTLVAKLTSNYNISEAKIVIYSYPGILLMSNVYYNTSVIDILYNYSFKLPITNIWVSGYVVLENGQFIKFTEKVSDTAWKGLPKWFVALLLLVAWAFMLKVIRSLTQDTTISIIITLIFIKIAIFLGIISGGYQYIVAIIIFVGALLLILLRNII